MDNFMDKLAQKFNAQEMIKANSQAEAAEMKKLQLQVAEYEKILQEMRKLNYKNTELADKIETLIGENAGKLQGLQEDESKLLTSLQGLTDEQTRNHEAQLALQETKKQDEETSVQRQESLFAHTEEHVHKENVKVYRNVQAVLVEETKKQTDALIQENARLAAKLNAVMAFAIIAMLLAAGSVGLLIFSLFL